MQLTAHRGFGERYPENTVCAVRRAAEVADGVEIDVRRAGDGELVASHFERLLPVAGELGRVKDLSAEELRALDVGECGCGVPRLERALDAVPADVRIDLDLKEPGLADDALAAAGAADNEVVVSSFYSDALWEARSLDAEATLAYNFDARLDRNLNTTRLLDCARANIHWSLCLGTDAVDRAKSQGLDVYAWPIGSRIVAWAVGRAGVDGVVATRPSVAEWARRGRRGEAFDRLPGSEAALDRLPGSEATFDRRSASRAAFDRLPESGAVARMLGLGR